MRGTLPSEGGGRPRPKDYVERAAALLPEIARRGGCKETWTQVGEHAAFFKSAQKPSFGTVAQSLKVRRSLL